MTATRSLPAKVALALLGLGLALAAGALNVRAADNPLTITAHVGYSDTIKA